MKILSNKLEITYLLSNSSATLTYENNDEGEVVKISCESEEEDGINAGVFLGFKELESIIKNFKQKVNKINLNKL